MGKNVRQNKIKEIILANEIDTQDELVEILNRYNFNVTQATVSRDIKELGLVKISGKTRKYKYAEVKNHDNLDHSKLLNLFKNCVIKITSAQNLVVVSTLNGNASSAGAVVDSLHLHGIVGSVAGDDTLLIISPTNEDAEYVVNELQKLI